MSQLIEFHTIDGDTINFKIEELTSLAINDYKTTTKEYVVKIKNGSREFEMISKSTFLLLMDKWYKYLAGEKNGKPSWSKK